MIEINNLVKKYGDKRAVSGISFTVNDDEVLGFLGPNGAGKTTTMNIISGYLSSTSGTVKVNGHDILEEPEVAKKQIGYLPENPPLYNDMTVREYLNYICDLKGVAKDQRKNQDAAHQLTHRFCPPVSNRSGLITGSAAPWEPYGCPHSRRRG